MAATSEHLGYIKGVLSVSFYSLYLLFRIVLRKVVDSKLIRSCCWIEKEREYESLVKY